MLKIVFTFTHWGMQSKANKLILDGYRLVNIERKTFIYYGYFAKDTLSTCTKTESVQPVDEIA
jgi:hypothetical protein